MPTRGSLEDTRQMLEGRLVEGGKKQRNVQDETDEGVAICLADEDGTFLEVPPVRDRDDSGGEDCGAVEPASRAVSDGEGGAHSDNVDEVADRVAVHARVAELGAGLWRADEEIDEVSSVREELASERERLANEKARYKQLWSNYCERLLLDDELTALKGRAT